MSSKVEEGICALCDFVSISKAKMLKHMKATHTKEEIQNPPQAKLMAEDLSICAISEDENEKPTTKSLSCGKGEFLAQEMKVLENHVKNTLEEKKHEYTSMEEDKQLTNIPIIKCDECVFVTRSEENVREHKKKKHAKENVKDELRKAETIIYMHSCISCIFKTNDYNSLKKHIEDTHKPPMTISCTGCDQTFIDNTQLEKHMNETHSSDIDQWPENKCGKCGKTIRTNIGRERHVQLYWNSCNLCSPEITSFDIHMSTQHCDLIEQKEQKEEHRCIKCEQIFDSLIDLERHDKTEHGTSQVSIPNASHYSCSKCSITFQNQESVTKHMEYHSQEEAVGTRTYCDQCDYICVNVADFISHIQTTHENPELISCRHCNYKALNKDKLYDHIENDHIEYAMLASVTAGQEKMETNFNQFKGELTDVLNKIFNTINKINENQTKIINDQNVIRQELFILRQSDCCKEVKKKKVDDTPPSEKAENSQAKVEEKESQSRQPRASTPSVFSTREAENASPKIRSKQNITWIGSSVSKVLKKEKLEKELNANVSIEEEKRFKENLKNVVPETLRKEDTDILVLESSSIEITDIEVEKAVNDGAKSITEYQKEWYMEAEKSSENLFSIAEDAIAGDCNLNVIIVKRLPRFDRKSKDMLGIKSKLSKFANHVYDQLWLKRGSPTRIHVVDLNLDCEEYPYLKETIFGKPSNPDYDGIRLIGPGASRQLNYRAVQTIKN